MKRFNKTRIRSLPHLVKVVSVIGIAAFFLGTWKSQAASIAYTITGSVYEAYTADGIRSADEPGVGAVTVTAYDGAGAVIASVLTNNDPATAGNYRLNIPASKQDTRAPVRLAISGLPAGFEQGEPDGLPRQITALINSQSRVDFSIYQAPPCPANPEIATSCFVYGNQISGPSRALPVVVSFPYDAGCVDLNLDGACDAAGASFDQPGTHTLSVPASQVGTTWGIAYRQNSRDVFAASFLKRHTGFGPGGPGAIYRINRTTGTVTPFITLSAGADPHPTPANEFTCAGAPGSYCWFYDVNALPLIGKMSLGGMDLSADESSLFVMNLFDRTLYQINVGTAAVTVTYPFPLGQADCTGDANDIRPFAVQVHRGVVYAGAVCTAESLAGGDEDLNRKRMRLYVYALDPAAAAPAFTQVFNYGPIGGFNSYRQARLWERWTSAFPQPGGAPCNYCTQPQPWLTGIDFDDNGDMILGLRDRFGDQGGYQVGGPTLASVGLNTVTAAGDTLRACSNGAGGWVMESNGTCGGVATGGAGMVAPNTVGGPPGPSGKYYFQDNANQNRVGFPEFNPALSMGAVLQVPGQPDVMVTAIDPKDDSPGDPGTNAAGTLRFNNRTPGLAGTRTRSYVIYRNTLNPGAFGKANGLGDLKALCDAPVVQVAGAAANAPVLAPDLVITKKADQNIVRPGDNVTFTITVTNKGTGPAINFALSDPVPDPLQVRSASASQGSFGISGNTVTFLIGTVNPGQTVTLTIQAHVPAGVRGPLDVYNIVISLDRTPRATEAIRITQGNLPGTGEHPDAPSDSGWLIAIVGFGALVTAVLLFRFRYKYTA